tara:strand:+ start:488 stop:1102 length:615 start_codon:yes stop_codon:yes gene_type:complete
MTGFVSLKKPIVAALLCLLVASFNTHAQTSAADIIAKARERARNIEEFKGVLNDPDQNVRLAAFEVMVTNGDPLMRELALDTGFASTDQVLRALAFKYAVLGLEQIILTLEKADSAPKNVQERTEAYLEKYGQKLVINIDTGEVDLNTGYFSYGNKTGNISGTVMTFTYGYYVGDLRLQDDNSLAGHVSYANGNSQFKATAPIR